MRLGKATTFFFSWLFFFLQKAVAILRGLNSILSLLEGMWDLGFGVLDGVLASYFSYVVSNGLLRFLVWVSPLEG